jgi:hypothetical protein
MYDMMARWLYLYLQTFLEFVEKFARRHGG